MSHPGLSQESRVKGSESLPAEPAWRAPHPRGALQDAFRSRRAPWRQELVDAERGLAFSFRADSSLHRHLFFDCLMLATCGVLGLTAIHWAVVIAALAAMLSAELFYQGLEALGEDCSPAARKRACAVGAAAKLLAFVGSTAAIGVVLWLRGRELFGA